MPRRLTETVALSEAAVASAAKTGRALIEFISPGWGASGYYSDAVLEAAARDRVIPKGTHMYADHPTATEDAERPVRSIKDLMAVTTEDAYCSDTGSLVGEVAVVPDWQPFLKTVAEDIGVSIRGSATDIVEGEAEGRKGGIIEGLVAPLFSVDFVTRAGRGGRVLQLLESAASVTRAIEHGLAEAAANDIRDALANTLRDAYGAEKTYVWVRDFDPDTSTVWFEVEAESDSGLYAQSYTSDGTALTGDRTEVRVQTSYVPRVDATATETSQPTPAGRTTITEESQEGTMGNITIEESEHTRLVEQAGRVTVLETERDTAISERDAATERATVAEGSLADRDRQDAARRIIEAAGTTFSPLEQRGLMADLPLAEDGTLDVAAFTTTVTEAAAAAGAGTVSGYGGSRTDATEAATATATALGDAFQKLGLSESQSAIAVKGR